MGLSRLFLLFIAYSFVGWACEVVYCSFLVRKFVNRGFLHGPICPVYGFGGLIIVFALGPFADSVPLLFVTSLLATSILEYATGWALETIFATKWWDYSGERFNVHGRVCLKNSLIFGALGVLLVRFMHPALVFLLSFIPAESERIIAVGIACVLAVDLAVTLRALVNFTARLASLKVFLENAKESFDVKEWFNELDLKGSLERLRARVTPGATSLNARLLATLESLLESPREMTRILSAFPGLKSRDAIGQGDLADFLHQIFPSRRPAKKAEVADSAVASAAAVGRARVKPFEAFWIFMIASYVGVILETVWCVVTTGHLESRTALLYGMMNPIYGAGALMMTAAFSRYELSEKKRDILIFLGSMLIGGAFEYLCSLGQELAFGSVSWEYSKTQFNLHGRTNLTFAMIWGVLGLSWIRYAYPTLLRLVRKIPVKLARALALAFFVVLAANVALSALAVRRWSDRSAGKPSSNRVEAFLDDRYPDEFMGVTYPNMTFVDGRARVESAAP
ncbi:MAG TPA: putative ABC transporter permease [Treponemataceae bacterium]|nr:putative ABC transporter permease [Treponemataceae bacterium]